MPAKLYRVTLSDEERQTLMSLIDQGKGPAGKRKRAHMLLLADEAQENGGWKDADIVKALHTSRRTVERVREKCVLQGIEAAGCSNREPLVIR
jgi:hypothetical protein